MRVAPAEKRVGRSPVPTRTLPTPFPDFPEALMWLRARSKTALCLSVVSFLFTPAIAKHQETTAVQAARASRRGGAPHVRSERHRSRSATRWRRSVRRRHC